MIHLNMYAENKKIKKENNYVYLRHYTNNKKLENSDL